MKTFKVYVKNKDGSETPKIVQKWLAPLYGGIHGLVLLDDAVTKALDRILSKPNPGTARNLKDNFDKSVQGITNNFLLVISRHPILQEIIQEIVDSKLVSNWQSVDGWLSHRISSARRSDIKRKRIMEKTFVFMFWKNHAIQISQLVDIMSIAKIVNEEEPI